MKTTICQQLTALILFISLPFFSIADNDYDKTYSKSFSTAGAERLSIENKYGDINIKNWNKQEVSIKVTVTVEASNEERARDLFEKISVTLEKRGSDIIGMTEFDIRSSRSNFSVDYEIFMPKSLNTVIDNRYGDIYINELTGHLDLNLKYGALRIRTLSRENETPHNKVDISYSENSHIRNCGWLKLNMAYSEIEVERSTALMILSRYSKLYTEVGNSIVAEGKYDNYNLGSLDKFIVDTKYSDIQIDKLQNRLETEMKYTDLEVEEISASFSSIEVDAQYGGVELGIAEEASYKLDAELQYAGIDYPSSDRVSVDEGYTNKHLKGYIGEAQNPEATVKIQSRYCEIELD